MKMRVVIRKQTGLVWEGDAESVSTTNQVGNFDILPEHANYVGTAEKYVIVRDGGKERKWEIDRAIVSVRDGRIEIFWGY